MENKILTIIEAKVDKNKWSQLIKEYEKVDRKTLPAAALSAHLIQDNNNPEIWRIVTVWEDLNAMKDYRESVEIPIWILIFENVGAKPELVISEIKSSK